MGNGWFCNESRYRRRTSVDKVSFHVDVRYFMRHVDIIPINI